MGDDADWNSVDTLMLRTLAAAEKVARYRYAQLSAMRLSGDLNVRPENVNVDELLENKAEWITVGPLIGMELVPLGSRTEGSLTVESKRIECDQRSGA